MHDPAAVEIFHNTLIPSFFDDVQHAVDILRKYIQAGSISEISLSTADVNSRMFRHSANSVYYAFLSECSELPEKLMKSYTEASVMWTNLPVTVGLHLPKSEYDRLQSSESEKAEALVSELGHLNTRMLLDLENSQEKLENMKERLALNAREAVISQYVDRIIAKSNELTSKQKELQDAANRVDEMAESIIAKCKLSEEDDQYYMWGKIIRLGTFMNTTMTNRANAKAQLKKDKAEAEAMGFDTSDWFEATYRITPADILDEIHTALSQYQSWFPETSVYVPAVKRYFYDVLAGKYPSGGTVVMATKDNLKHPVLQLGDIVQARKGQAVNTAEQFTAAKDCEGPDTITYLRLEDGVLRQHTESNPENNVLVGMLQLVE